MRNAIITLEQKALCPICAGPMRTCKVNVECEGRVFRCATCALWQSEGYPASGDLGGAAAIPALDAPVYSLSPR
jgi:hypothetical protein